MRYYLSKKGIVQQSLGEDIGYATSLAMEKRRNSYKFNSSINGYILLFDLTTSFTNSNDDRPVQLFHTVMEVNNMIVTPNIPLEVQEFINKLTRMRVGYYTLKGARMGHGRIYSHIERGLTSLGFQNIDFHHKQLDL